MAASTAWLTRAGCHCPFCPGCLHGMLHRRVVFQPGWAIMGERCFVNLLARAPLGRCRPVEPSRALWCAAPHTKETPPSLPGLLHALQASVMLLLLDSVLLWFVDVGRRDQRPRTTFFHGPVWGVGPTPNIPPPSSRVPLFGSPARLFLPTKLDPPMPPTCVTFPVEPAMTPPPQRGLSPRLSLVLGQTAAVALHLSGSERGIRLDT